MTTATLEDNHVNEWTMPKDDHVKVRRRIKGHSCEGVLDNTTHHTEGWSLEGVDILKGDHLKVCTSKFLSVPCRVIKMIARRNHTKGRSREGVCYHT